LLCTIVDGWYSLLGYRFRVIGLTVPAVDADAFRRAVPGFAVCRSHST
jgi:hypothetical protein